MKRVGFGGGGGGREWMITEGEKDQKDQKEQRKTVVKDKNRE
jgi:hypothetical protein